MMLQTMTTIKNTGAILALHCSATRWE